MNSEKFQRAISEIDAANSKDPNQEKWEGKQQPKALLYGQRMSAALAEFAPNSSEALQLAARAQHICRWHIPRSTYPMNKVGYHNWRNDLKKFHAEKTGEILQSVGYDSDLIERVQFLLQKKQLKRDAETQTLEDVICHVFLKYYAAEFAADYDEDKMIRILQKTWRKMSERGQQFALQLDLPSAVTSLVKKALA